MPANGIGGGIAILWNDDLFQAVDITMGTYCLSAFLSPSPWLEIKFHYVLLLCMAQRRAIEKVFFSELLDHKPAQWVMCLVKGDFSQIYHPRDKNKWNVNHVCISRFRANLHAWLWAPRGPSSEPSGIFRRMFLPPWSHAKWQGTGLNGFIGAFLRVVGL